MAFFDWLFGKRRKPNSASEVEHNRSYSTDISQPKSTASLETDFSTAGDVAPGTRGTQPKPPRPKVLHGLEENSPFLLIDGGSGAATIMDREMFDYLYEESQAPDPSQRRLDEMLQKVTRVRALACGMFRGRALGSEVILDTTDPKALARLRQTLKILESPHTFDHCGCLGGPTLEFFANQELVATIGLHHGHAIRWAEWKHDAHLWDGRGLNDWLIQNGIDAALLDILNQNQYDAGALMGVAPMGFQRRGPALLSPAEQRLRLVELRRVRGGDLEAALRDCQQELGAQPDLAFGYAVRALIHYQQGDQTRCIADCTEAIRLGLCEAEIFFTRAVVQDYLGRPQEALADCTAALEIDPQHVNAYNSRGLIRARMGQLDEAQADLSQAIRLAPKWFLPYLHRGQVYYNLGEIKMAVADYDQAIHLLKEMPPGGQANEAGSPLALVYCRRGEARYDQFQEEEAEDDFAEARRLDPGSAAGYLGDMWLRRSQFGRALEVFSQLIQSSPKDHRGYTGRGMAREALGELEQAVADYSSAIRLESSGVGYALRARVRQRQGRMDDALADLSEHLRLHPNDPMSYLSRSDLYKQRGELAEALNDLNTAHRVAPDDPLVCNNLAWMLATCPEEGLRDGNRAVALARQACLATEWKNPYCLDTLAAACAETSAFDEAVRWQIKAVDLSTEDLKSARKERLQMYQAGQPYRT
jgi:tetratricopeptide (TPR) repeat protein